jgi:hypothetical protein
VEGCAKVTNETWYHLTHCHAFALYVRSKLKYVSQLKDIKADYLSSQPLRSKRGILDFGGDILKFLFGTFSQTQENITNTLLNWKKNKKSFCIFPKNK